MRLHLQPRLEHDALGSSLSLSDAPEYVKRRSFFGVRSSTQALAFSHPVDEPLDDMLDEVVISPMFPN